jgi:xanthine dehydrogenase YagS FAD-binding subunit
VVLGGVAPTPYRAAATEDYLTGRSTDGVSTAHAGSVAIDDPRPLPDNAYKLPLTANLVNRALQQLLRAR